MSIRTNESSFFKHIAHIIEGLTSTYTYILEELEKKDLLTSASMNNHEYTFLLKKLNRAIDAFKTEMKACLSDYIYMKTLNIMNEKNATHFIKNQLNELHKKRDHLIENIPEEELKTGLGHNYYFNKNIKNLTPETIMHYFEINYTLVLETDLKK